MSRELIAAWATADLDVDVLEKAGDALADALSQALDENEQMRAGRFGVSRGGPVVMLAKKLIGMLGAWAALKTMYLRGGVTLLEAVEIDQFETELRMVAATAEERADLRALTILAGKCGLRAGDIGVMARHYSATNGRVTE